MGQSMVLLYALSHANTSVYKMMPHMCCSTQAKIPRPNHAISTTHHLSRPTLSRKRIRFESAHHLPRDPNKGV